MSAPAPLLGHGLGKHPAPPEWPPLTAAEVARVLGGYGTAGPYTVTWRSPRPWSAAALVTTADGGLFVKRHHRAVRDEADLAAEHGFIAHLRGAGIPGVTVPEVITARDGRTVAVDEPWIYEVHAPAPGADVYRDALSWTPYRGIEQARAAGAALARLHLAAAGYAAPPRPGPPLLCASSSLLTAADPEAAVRALLARRPATAAYLEESDGTGRLVELVSGAACELAPVVAQLPSAWSHNDWHGSNLLWDAAGGTAVTAVIDFGLADRTGPAFDLATALERSTVSWLDLTDPDGPRPPAVAMEQVAALLDGYRSVRPLPDAERRALPQLLPVAHVELALSEVEYYLAVRADRGSADLAYRGYLWGHARFFASPPGRRMLDGLRRLLEA